MGNVSNSPGFPLCPTRGLEQAVDSRQNPGRWAANAKQRVFGGALQVQPRWGMFRSLLAVEVSRFGAKLQGKKKQKTVWGNSRGSSYFPSLFNRRITEVLTVIAD